MAVEDRSAPGSPLVISGTVEIRETGSGSSLRVSLSEHNIVARNISSKTILALVVWLDVLPSYASPQRFVRQYECFFAPDVINPGDDHSLTEPTVGEQIEPYDPSRPAETARAEARTVYVQFLDGSIFGDEGFGDHLRTLRRQTRRHLHHLDKTYTHRGEAAFLEELNETVEPGEVDVLVENVRRTQKRLGTSAAIGQIRRMLEFARERQSGFTSSAE